MKFYIFVTFLTLILAVSLSCDKQDSGINTPDPEPPFSMRVHIQDYNDHQPIANATVIVEYTTDDTVFVSHTNANGDVITPQFPPQIIQLTVEHDDFYSPYNGDRFDIAYADSFFPLSLTEYIAPSDTFYFPSNYTDMSAMTWRDNKLLVAANINAGLAPFRILQFDYTQNELQLEDSWVNPTVETSYGFRWQQSIMWDFDSLLLWSNCSNATGNYYLEDNSLLFTHQDDYNRILHDYIFYYYEFGYRYAEDLSWYDNQYFWGCKDAKIYRTTLFRKTAYPDSTHLREYEEFIFPASYEPINGVEYDGQNHLWACNGQGTIFRLGITEADTLGNVDQKYNVKNTSLFDMAGDRNGNLWVLGLKNYQYYVYQFNFED